MSSKISATQKNMLVTVASLPLTGPPARHSLGKYKGKSKVSNKANKKVKALFHNGAMSAIQHCKEIKEYYQRKVGEGKNEMLVINNVCNKLVHRIFACISRREKYNENYTQSFA